MLHRCQRLQSSWPHRHWLPSPSKGRGIEGEGWSYPEPPPVRCFLYQPPSGVPAENFAQNTRNITFITFNQSCPPQKNTRAAIRSQCFPGENTRPRVFPTAPRGRNRCAPSRVGITHNRHRRAPKTPVISLLSFLRFETAPHNHPIHRRRPTGGRARHSVRAAIDLQADKLSPTAAIPMLKHFPQKPRINNFITMNERLQTRVARATGPYRPATRRTERVRRSFCQRTPFVIGASSFFRYSTFVIRHSQTEIIKNPRNITFYLFTQLETTMNAPLKRHPHQPTSLSVFVRARPWLKTLKTPEITLLAIQALTKTTSC